MKSDTFLHTSSETVDCPIHHLPLVLTQEGGRSIAVCNCPVNPNPWAGKPVVERLEEPADTEGAI